MQIHRSTLQRSSKRSKKSKSNVPKELRVFLCLPTSIGSMSDYEWHGRDESPSTEPRWREEMRGALTQFAAPTVEEQIQVEVERALKLPPDEFRAWMTEAQKRHDAALANPMCWGGAA